jgi:hypothetical protein
MNPQDAFLRAIPLDVSRNNLGDEGARALAASRRTAR